MHKTNGWLLREIGNKDEEVLLDFLKFITKIYPRTTLRYAIEKTRRRFATRFLKVEFKIIFLEIAKISVHYFLPRFSCLLLWFFQIKLEKSIFLCYAGRYRPFLATPMFDNHRCSIGFILYILILQ